MKVVQETLGLSSITIATDTYTSVLPTWRGNPLRTLRRSSTMRGGAHALHRPRRDGQGWGTDTQIGWSPIPAITRGLQASKRRESIAEPCRGEVEHQLSGLFRIAYQGDDEYMRTSAIRTETSRPPPRSGLWRMPNLYYWQLLRQGCIR